MNNECSMRLLHPTAIESKIWLFACNFKACYFFLTRSLTFWWVFYKTSSFFPLSSRSLQHFRIIMVLINLLNESYSYFFVCRSKFIYLFNFNETSCFCECYCWLRIFSFKFNTIECTTIILKYMYFSPGLSD